MQLKIACPGIVLALAGSPDGVYCAAAISEKIHVWEVINLIHLMTVQLMIRYNLFLYFPPVSQKKFIYIYNS